MHLCYDLFKRKNRLEDTVVEVKILKSVIKNIKNFKNNCLEVSFVNNKRVSVDEVEFNEVTEAFGTTYLLNAISFVGINAVGKTTTVELLNTVLNVYIDRSTLNHNSDRLRAYMYKNESSELENYFLINDYIYKTVATIEEKDNKLFFADEWIYRKSIRKVPRAKIFDQIDFEEFINRKSIVKQMNELKLNVLKNDESIFDIILNSEKISRDFKVYSTLFNTNMNFLTSENEAPSEFVKYLDPSIEKFHLIETDKKIINFIEQPYLLKMVGESEKIIRGIELSNYISSGTIKGLNILNQVFKVLKVGGYLFIDEIENHLNKNIVLNIINIFTSDTNSNGATLIFTTHYSELLDSVKRSDSINVLIKDKLDIKLSLLSDLVGKKDRTDALKSELILSGNYGTAPSYYKYMDVIKYLKKECGQDE